VSESVERDVEAEKGKKASNRIRCPLVRAAFMLRPQIHNTLHFSILHTLYITNEQKKVERKMTTAMVCNKWMVTHDAQCFRNRFMFSHYLSAFTHDLAIHVLIVQNTMTEEEDEEEDNEEQRKTKIEEEEEEEEDEDEEEEEEERRRRKTKKTKKKTTKKRRRRQEGHENEEDDEEK